jgi:glycosyltransferase involved in cell wall biosynthesis
MAGDGRHWLERWARLKRPDLAVCNSHFSARRFSEWFSCERVELVYCPVSFPAVRERVQRATLRSAFRTSLQDVVIVQVSRLERLKGQHVLIAALAKLRDLPGWTCWIVGGAQRRSETAYLRQVEALARGEGIADRIRFVGERRDVPAILEAADIFCQPNTSPEAFGLSLVEAMHAGLPVVTSGIGGACEIVDGSCGVLTPPRDASALSNALRGLIVDRGLRAGLSAAARRRPDVICQASRQIRRIEEVLSSIAAA